MHRLLARNLAFAYHKGFPLFQGLSFELNAGDLLHLVGANGVGKSSLLAVLAGLLHKSSGEVRREGAGQTPYFAYLAAEKNGLYLALDALSNLRYIAQLFQQQPSRVELLALLTRWGLGHPLICEKLPLSKFSTGMKRRLALACIEVTAAPCLLLDEPTHGLDKEGLALCRAYLAAHCSRGGSAIVVSHLEGLFAEQSHRVLELRSARSHGGA